MLTETEARKKWCPFARVVEHHVEEGQSRPRNRVAKCTAEGVYEDTIAEKLAGANCIASQCMAWEWGGNTDAMRGKNRTLGDCGLKRK